MKRALLALAAAAGLVLLPASPASAHPMGNFSVNQYLGLTLHPDRVDARFVLDIAEIPTLQDRPAVDTDGSGTIVDGERTAYAERLCASVTADVRARAGATELAWTVTSADFAYLPGSGGLDVSRATCTATAAADLANTDSFEVANRHLADRIGWRELTAAGAGVRLVSSPVPATSVSDELRDYPDDLLSSALDVRSASLRLEPGTGSDGLAGSISSGADPISRWMASVDRTFQDLAGGPNLTPLVGLLAVALALLLGAGHALLPGHGKTVLAAYLAGRRGRPRDAITVAGTVTLTHTGGVLVVGLIITAGTALAGEQILSWLGFVSGAVVLAVGTSMLVSVVRRRTGAHTHIGTEPHTHLRPTAELADIHQCANDTDRRHSHDVHDGHNAEPGQHEHEPHEQRPHEHGQHDRRHSHSLHEQDHRVHYHDEHDHAPDPGGHDHSRVPSGHNHTHESGGHDRAHGPHRHGEYGHGGGGHGHGKHGHHHGGSGRWGLAGIGVAGGLVPSPSALVVLLAAIGLGRTGFGILLVVAYGAGMAATLTGAGLLLLAIQRRIERGTRSRFTTWPARLATRLNAATPTATAALVVVVGAALALRAAPGLI